jgi:hypothetical protein
MENTIHTPEEEQPQVETPKRTAGLSINKVDRYLRFIVFLVAIGMVYIWNSHWAENQIRHEEQLEEAIREAKAEYKTSHARLSHDSKRSEVAQRVDTLGLIVPKDPPFTIIKKK